MKQIFQRYALALFWLAQEENQISEFMNECQQILKIFAKNQDFLQLIKNDALKKEEKKDKRKSLMDGVSKSQSALLSALKISKKAVSVGFEWQNEQQIYDCVKSEFEEFKEAKNFDEKEDEFGDILFATVNLARYNKINPELALIRANKKFMARFKKMEELTQKPLETLSFEEYDQLWKKAKIALKTDNNVLN